MDTTSRSSPELCSLAVTSCFNDLGQSWQGFNHLTSACYANTLTDLATVVVSIYPLTFIYIKYEQIKKGTCEYINVEVDS